MNQSKTTAWSGLLIILALVVIGLFFESTRPACSEFVTANMNAWSKADTELYLTCKK